MKKLLLLIPAFFILAFQAPASDQLLQFGLSLPFSTLSSSRLRPDVDSDIYGAGLSFTFVNIADRGFTLRLSTDNYYAWDSKMKSGGKNFDGRGMDFFAGIGGALIHDERMSLTLTGNIGTSSITTKCSKKIPGEYYTEYLDTEISSTIFSVGPNVCFTYRLNGNAGLFAELGAYCSLGSCSITSNKSTPENPSSDSEDKSVSGWTIKPRLGFSFIF